MESIESIKLPLLGQYGEGKFTLVDGDYDGEYFGQYRWYLLKNGYVGRINYDLHYTKRSYSYLHREVANPPIGLWVDHINRDKLDNRSCNLRWVTPKENAQNRPSVSYVDRKQFAVKNSTTGMRGVMYKPKQSMIKPWYVSCRKKHIGNFRTKEEAAHAYDIEALKNYGDKAILNFPA